VAEMLKLSDWEYQSTKTNKSHVMQKVDNMKEQIWIMLAEKWTDIDNVSREMATVRQIQKEMVGSQNTITEIKNAFDGLINRLDMLEVSVKIEDIPTETFKTKIKGKKKRKIN